MGARGIEYVAMPEFGGRRTPRQDSRNTAWRNRAFRGYADHMETEEFRIAAGRLESYAVARMTALMCAEALWWRCHRALIADYLKARGFDVVHLTSQAAGQPHPYTAPARVIEGRLVYANWENDFFGG